MMAPCRALSGSPQATFAPEPVSFSKPNQRYSIVFTITAPWTDDGLPANPKGFDSSQVPGTWQRLLMRAGSPLRRVFFRGWFHPIARVGAKGTAEYFLDPYPKKDGTFVGEFKTERAGELFLYVNDAALPIPYLYNLFYRNNGGSAIIKVHRLCDARCKENRAATKKVRCNGRPA